MGLEIDLNMISLIASIFLMGAIFTYLVIRIQKGMLKYLDNNNIESIAALVNAIEARDEYTKGHSQHVANLIELYCIELTEKEKNKNNIDPKRLKIAGLLHDIGKIGVKEVILNKPGQLDDIEYAAISRHPEIGNHIISSVSHLKDIANWIYYHHERVDGNGYYGKKGKEIPYESRVLAVCDTYSAIVTDRVYRKGLPHEKAVEVLKTLKDTQLDSDILEKFIKIQPDKLEKCKENVFKIQFNMDENIELG